MTATTNPLLATINKLPIFKIPCQRKYTTIRKNNKFRVKFYGVANNVPNRRELINTLAKEGWTKIVVSRDTGNWNGIRSLTVVASK